MEKTIIHWSPLRWTDTQPLQARPFGQKCGRQREINAGRTRRYHHHQLIHHLIPCQNLSLVNALSTVPSSFLESMIPIWRSRRCLAQHSRRSQNFKTYFAVTCVKYVCKIWETGSTVWPPFDVSIKTYFKIPRIQGNSNVGTSCYSRKTVCWKPPCCWLRWEGPWAMVTSIIATKVGLV